MARSNTSIHFWPRRRAMLTFNLGHRRPAFQHVPVFPHHRPAKTTYLTFRGTLTSCLVPGWLTGRGPPSWAYQFERKKVARMNIDRRVPATVRLPCVTDPSSGLSLRTHTRTHERKERNPQNELNHTQKIGPKTQCWPQPQSLFSATNAQVCPRYVRPFHGLHVQRNLH